jgi:hypothetical protein
MGKMLVFQEESCIYRTPYAEAALPLSFPLGTAACGPSAFQCMTAGSNFVLNDPPFCRSRQTIALSPLVESSPHIFVDSCIVVLPTKTQLT